jgi:hypothetical protein
MIRTWGEKHEDSGRYALVRDVPEYHSTTKQACGLFPFVVGSGSPSRGVPIGRHILWGETVSCDPFAWLDAGLVTNLGMFVAGQPGVGKSSFAKRVTRGCMAKGVRPLYLGDLKPDYTRVVRSAGGQVIEIGRGMDSLNALDAGPLGAVLSQLSGAAAETLRAEIRGRRIAALMALCSLVRAGDPITNVEESVLGAAIDIVADGSEFSGVQPVIPDVLAILDEEPVRDRLLDAAAVPEFRRRQGPVAAARAFEQETRRLRQTFRVLIEGSLAGVFDRQTSTVLDLDAPAVSVDISRVAASGDTLLAAAMLSTWSYGFAMIQASQALHPERSYFAVLDELWRALRGTAGIVDHVDTLTRVYRARRVAHMFLTHSLADLDALPTEADRAKARGFVDRCAITVLAGLTPREVADFGDVITLTKPERDMIASWSAPETWQPGIRHPGRGRYMLKTGARVGLPVQMTLIGDEPALYHTDTR